jgi:hypothetical protein
MNFFFDRCMSPRLAKMIDELEDIHTVRHHDTRFKTDTPDIVWLANLAADESPSVVISGDGRILRNKVERQALREARLTFFCMSRTWGHMKIAEYAWKFVKVWPEIVRNAQESSERPRIFEVSAGKGLKVRLRGGTQDPD